MKTEGRLVEDRKGIREKEERERERRGTRE